MSSINDYKRHMQVLKMEQKIGRIQRELESVDYGDGCPIHGENDCAEVRKAYDRGYVNGLYEAWTFFKLIEADTPQTESTGSPIGDYRDGAGAWAPMPLGDPGSISDGTLLTALETWLNRNPDKQIKVDKRITRHGPVFTASIELAPWAIQKEG